MKMILLSFALLLLASATANVYKSLFKRYLLIFYCLMFASQALADGTSDMEVVLSLAGKNRSELEAVLKYYERDANKEKLAAAKFLIGNMRWHASPFPIKKEQCHTMLDSLTRAADSLYYHCIENVHPDSVRTKKVTTEIIKVRKPFWQAASEQLKGDNFVRPLKNEYDYKVLTASELIAHIDHVFSLREKVTKVKQLSFDDFCEYVLPYRSVPEYTLVDLPMSYYALLEKYFTSIPQDSLLDRVKRYNVTLSLWKSFFPKYPYSGCIGYEELFFNGFHDCIPIALYGASTLRMLGIPAAVEYNVAYKQFRGTHYMCSVLGDDGKWWNYSPESSLPSEAQNKRYAEDGAMNVYRLTFGAQRNTPFFLRGEKEFVPEELYSPFMKDVSSRLLPTVSLELPFKEVCGNRLAYLATFSSEWDDGLVPVTWGQIDNEHQQVTFDQVVTSRIYFPIYYTSTGESVAFFDPFYINASGEKVNLSTANDQKVENYYVTRKFPWKPKMKEYSSSLVGTVVLASNHSSMNPRDTVAQISTPLQPYFQDIALDTCRGPYTYYRIKTTQESPRAHIAEIQFLTDSSFHYNNVCAPLPLEVLQPKDTLLSAPNEVRLLDKPLEKVKWKTEYDGNPQTAPSVYPTINFSLKQPQYVTKIRLMPIHADNGVVPGDVYQLLHWKGKQWEKLGEQTARYNYLSYPIVKGDLYWLQNLSKGKEELPFVVDKNGRQQFVYYDIMKD